MSKQEQSRRSIRLPQKTGINMNMREKRTGKYVTVIVGVCLTSGNMVLTLMGTPLIASPINCGALAMLLSLIIVPVVSLFTKSVPFEVNPPSPEGAIDREYQHELAAERKGAE